MKYSLEIYDTNSDEALKIFESDSPFMAISVGDSMNPGSWNPDAYPADRLSVTKVEHLIWEAKGGLRHKIIVSARYTKVPGTQSKGLTMTEEAAASAREWLDG